MEFKKKLLLINVQELLFYAGMVSLSFIAVILGEREWTAPLSGRRHERDLAVVCHVDRLRCCWHAGR